MQPPSGGAQKIHSCGSENGAHRLAIAYTVMGTCKMNGGNQSHHLPYIFDELSKKKI